MDLVKLRRDLQGPAEAYVAGHPHDELDAACERLGLPVLAREEGATKRKRFERCFAALPDDGLPAVGHVQRSGVRVDLRVILFLQVKR
ncbi:hypothetical protein [Actinomadura sp. CNU-125]|uniref:hypothetical protein n=1 Tax=Actinomadura sp. CNU-125 TaxID=1904961 RepID=UPI00096AB526|nr:hypothetical protein [Actinomadura sp. CNU-125]